VDTHFSQKDTVANFKIHVTSYPKLEQLVPPKLQHPPTELRGVTKRNLILNGRRMSAMVNVISCQECKPIEITGINTTIADSVTISYSLLKLLYRVLNQKSCH
jgi:hypothetical protein